MNKILISLSILMLFSCKKEDDVLNYSYKYSGFRPENESVDINLQGVNLSYHTIEREGLASYVKEYRLYFDTINPPRNIVNKSETQFQNYTVSNLQPNRTYYWAYSILIPSKEVWTDIQSFTTIDFSGTWTLESVVDKRGQLDVDKVYNRPPNFTYWYDWSHDSKKLFKDSNNNCYTIKYTLNSDSMLNAEAKIEQIIFYSDAYAIVKFFKSKKQEYADFKYNTANTSASFRITTDNTEFYFPSIYIGYDSYSKRSELKLLTEKGLLFIYTR